ncbi:hypothetical protein EMPS_02588 [Entomortierella parvispora]|uniref:FAD-binding domain-containing protein n=1 Tax=Entomortierella parvispora TaxID=205924 RepID=A0A9P3LTT9_9FUNG|nr:hypothetical protein EMPS_02588 [Entomortierella parvispora]
MENDLPQKYPSKLPPTSDGKNPHTLIAGAGLAGLLLAILLERAGIPYELFERSPEAKPLGSIISLSANVLPVFEQLGMYEELKATSLPGSTFEILNADLERISLFHTDSAEAEVIGYIRLHFSRPRLYDLLLSKIPSHKTHFSKKILNLSQNKDGVMIRCADGTTYHGDVLVGSDGAHSAVRQSLYKQMADSSILPPSDALDLNKGYTCLVGTTSPVDAEKFPVVEDKDNGGVLVIGNNNSWVWGLHPVGDNRIAWSIISQIATKAKLEDLKFRNAEWGPESHPEMISEVRNFNSPYGKTLGDLIDATPSESISRVFLEDKLFQTWHHNRTVLIGDAAHKLLPSSGQGANNAFEDAIVLANCLYDIGTPSLPDVKAALKSYKDQRLPHVLEQYEASKASAKFLYGHTFFERCIRHVVFNWVPKSKLSEMMQKDAAYRPQATFLPLAPKRGKCYIEPQFPNKRYEAEQKAKQTAAAV